MSAMRSLPDADVESALVPIKVLRAPVVMMSPAVDPKAELEPPVVTALSAV
jgi:hypothetical protein